jgi:N-acyl-D-amino-acid deacylase
MDVQYLIKNGTVVDGTGASAYRADLRVSRGRIAKIGHDLPVEGRERVIDATGCYVTPGFIESHNHWDAGVWWSPMLEPVAAYGITTTINGNCGFSVAPMQADPAVRAEMIDIFNYFEDIPRKAQEQMIPWNWRTWSEYRAELERNVKLPANFAAFCGHIPIRLTVMGLEAWDRAATAAEIAQMCNLLEDALTAGALGMSSNLMDRDRNGRAILSKQADQAEWTALLSVIGRHPGAMLQIIFDTVRDLDGAEQLERLARLAKVAGARMLWLGMPMLKFQADSRPAYEALHERFKAEGLPFWTTYSHVAPTVVFSFNAGLTFGQNGAQAWQDLVNLKDENAKLALVADPAWRETARKSWDGMYAHSTYHDPTCLTFLESETGYGPIGVTLADYMVSAGFAHASDALADWLQVNGFSSVLHKRAWEYDDEAVLSLLRDPRAAGNASDGGAHGQTLCGAGDNAALFTIFVRDRAVLSIEEAVHVATGQLAECFSLMDRGVLKEGMRADLTVFNLAEIERRPQEKIWDVPDGEGGRTYRYTRAPAPMRLTLCNGVARFDNGAVTGQFPGQVIGLSGPESHALAAE